MIYRVIKMTLNEKQKKVVYTHKHFLFLLAGAGSGKTRVIVERIKYLLNQEVCEDDILCLTFTRKAAHEMRTRLNQKIKNIYTFHSLALNQLKTIYKEYQLINHETIGFDQRELLNISKYKNSLYHMRKPKIFDAYQMKLYQLGVKDFDDLLLDYLEYLEKYKKTYTYIFIDEFQDTNKLQYHILKKLIGKDSYVLAVGDPDQSIYQFRGADVFVIDRFIKEYQADVEILDLNYRSTPQILSLANGFIKRNHRSYKKVLKPYRNDQFEVKKYVFEDINEETTFILKQYKNCIKEGIKPSEIAILYRNHLRVSHLKKALKKTFIDTKYGLQLLSMHQAKGLEFDCVFIIGLEDQEIPSAFTQTYMTLEEERRLMYVAMTRARKYLYMTYTKYADNYRKKSIFYKEIKIK